MVSTVRMSPIGPESVDAAAAFLNRNLNPRVSPAAWAALMSPPWPVDAPAAGFQLVDGDEVVGVYVAIHSTRMIGGSVHRVCNMGPFCVLEDYRAHGLRLVRSMLAQRGFDFTDLSPSGNVIELNRRLGFIALDVATAFSPNLGIGRRSDVEITSNQGLLESWLGESLLQIYEDHRGAAAARHVALRRGDRVAYVVVRRDRRKRLPIFASVLFVGGDKGLLEEGWVAFGRHLLLVHGALITLAELRVIGFRPSGAITVDGRPKMFKSDSLKPDDVDYLYSELTCLEW